MIRAIRHCLRLAGLARTFARHDALFVIQALGASVPLPALAKGISRPHPPGRPGQRLARALHDAGPSFIKLGQALSTRSDLLEESVAADLSELQDRLPPFAGAEARAIVAAELGRPLEQMFCSFDDQPVAAASIAQVHFAIDSDGREVAVKVLRPGIERAFARDLNLFLWAAELAESRIPAMRRLRPVESIRTFAETVTLEMDLRFEAAAASELAANFEGDRDLHVPAVDWSRTGRRVMTTERITGIKIDEREALIAAGHDPHAVLEKAARTFFFQVFRDGFFHADLHPGNLFVRADGSIGAIDFGIMGRLDRPTRRHLAEMLLAFLTGDYRRAAEVHFEAGWVPADRSVETFAQACRSIAEPILDKPQNQISVARLLGQLFQITETFAMQVQPQLLLLQKTMLLAEGTGRRLCPEANMWFIARPLIQEWMIEALRPDVRLREAATEAAAAVVRLPQVLRDIERAARRAADDGRTAPFASAGGAFARPAAWLPWLLLALAVIALLLD